MLQRSSICLSAVLFCGCSNDISLNFFYDDELVEAPTREVELKIFDGEISCDDYLSFPHGTDKFSNSLVKEVRTGYPVITQTLAPDLFLEGRAFTFAAEAYDRNGVSIARGCSQKVAGDFDQVSLQLFGLAKCSKPAGEIDLALVVDTSSRSLAKDPDLRHLKAIQEIMLEESLFSTWTVISTAPTPKVWVSRTSTASELYEAFEGIAETYTAPNSAHFDAIDEVSRLLRSQSLCGRIPAVFIFSAGVDKNSELTWQNARLGLEGSLVDPEDNIFAVGITQKEDAFGEFLNFIPQNSGNAYLAQHAEFLEAQLLEVREQLSALVQRP